MIFLDDTPSKQKWPTILEIDLSLIRRASKIIYRMKLRPWKRNIVPILPEITRQNYSTPHPFTKDHPSTASNKVGLCVFHGALQYYINTPR